MKKNFYAIKKGFEGTQIVNTWEACEKMIKGFSGAEYKAFETLEEANDYLTSKSIKEVCDDLAQKPHYFIRVGDNYHIDFVKRGEVLLSLNCKEDIRKAIDTIGYIIGSPDYVSSEKGYSKRLLELYQNMYDLEQSKNYKRNRYYAVKTSAHSFDDYFVTRNPYTAMLHTENQIGTEIKVFKTQALAEEQIKEWYGIKVRTIQDWIAQDSGERHHIMVYGYQTSNSIEYAIDIDGEIGFQGKRNNSVALEYGPAYGGMVATMKAISMLNEREEKGNKIRIFYVNSQSCVNLKTCAMDDTVFKYFNWMNEHAKQYDIEFTEVDRHDFQVELERSGLLVEVK